MRRAKSLPPAGKRQFRNAAPFRKLLKEQRNEAAAGVPLYRQVHFTIAPTNASVLASPLLVLSNPTSPAAAPASTKNTVSDFAALLESMETDIAPAETQTPIQVKAATNKKKDVQETADQNVSQTNPAPADKFDKENGKHEKEPADHPTIVAPLVSQVPDREPLPLTLAFPIPVQVPGEKNLQDRKSVRATADPLTSIVAAENTSAVPLSDSQAPLKLTSVRPLELLTTPKASVRKSPLDAPRSEIAIEAKLTPRETETPEQPVKQASSPSKNPEPAKQQNTPTASLTAAPSTQTDMPSTQHDGVKPSEKVAAPEAKPEQKNEPLSTAPRPATPHATELVAKPSEQIAAVPQAVHAPAQSQRASTANNAPAAPTAAADIPEPAPVRTEPARDISFRIGANTADPVDVQLVDRAGQIHVAVRSADPALTRSLQANVSDLAGKLERSGFQTETFTPHRTEPARESQQNSAFQDSQKDRRAPQQEFQQQKKRTLSSDTTFTLTMDQEN